MHCCLSRCALWLRRLSILLGLSAAAVFCLTLNAQAQIDWSAPRTPSLADVQSLGTGHYARDFFEEQKGAGNPALANLQWEDLHPRVSRYVYSEPYWVPEGHYVGEAQPEAVALLQSFAAGGVIGGPGGSLIAGLSTLASLGAEIELKNAGYTDYEATGLGQGIGTIVGLAGGATHGAAIRYSGTPTGVGIRAPVKIGSRRAVGRPSRVFAPIVEGIESRIQPSGGSYPTLLSITDIEHTTGVPLVRLAITRPQDYAKQMQSYSAAPIHRALTSASSSKHTREGLALIISKITGQPFDTLLELPPADLIEEGMLSGFLSNDTAYTMWEDTDVAIDHAALALNFYQHRNFALEQKGVFEPANIGRFVEMPNLKLKPHSFRSEVVYLRRRNTKHPIRMQSYGAEAALWMFPVKQPNGQVVVIPALKHFMPLHVKPSGF